MAVVPPPPVRRSPSTPPLLCSVYMGQRRQQCLPVWNNGTGTLNYAISPDSANSAWLAVTPASGASTGEHDRIQINYTTARLAVGSYTGLVSIASADATNSPQTVKVIMAVLPPLPGPTIAYSPSSFSRSVYLNGNAGSNVFSVWNAGTGTLNYALSSDSIWLSTVPTGGSITNSTSGTQTGGNSSGANRIQINYDIASLGLGTYTGLITITSADATNSPQIGEGRHGRRAPAARSDDSPRRLVLLAQRVHGTGRRQQCLLRVEQRHRHAQLCDQPRQREQRVAGGSAGQRRQHRGARPHPDQLHHRGSPRRLLHRPHQHRVRRRHQLPADGQGHHGRPAPAARPHDCLLPVLILAQCVSERERRQQCVQRLERRHRNPELRVELRLHMAFDGPDRRLDHQQHEWHSDWRQLQRGEPDPDQLRHRHRSGWAPTPA